MVGSALCKGICVAFATTFGSHSSANAQVAELSSMRKTQELLVLALCMQAACARWRSWQPMSPEQALVLSVKGWLA